MISYHLSGILDKNDSQQWTIDTAEKLLHQENQFLTDTTALHSKGKPNEYYSNGDYWWPNPETTDGLPYIQRDGESNPDNFSYHRMALRQMKHKVSFWTMAYHHTKNPVYSQAASRLLQQFFLDDTTGMAPHLTYAQAIPGVSDGRGIGIIDTLHLTELPFAIELLHKEQQLSPEIYRGLTQWFEKYLHWMLTHPNGIDEMNTTNNHAICFFVQVASFARFTQNQSALAVARSHYKEHLMEQLAEDGSFPYELRRTKPYSYSLFTLDNLVTLCHLLSTPEDSLWGFRNSNGIDLAKATAFLTPYISHKERWPYEKDVEYFEDWPVRMSFLLFAGLALEEVSLIDLYYNLPKSSPVLEVQRNVAIEQPLLLLL